MAYTKTVWVNDTAPAINASNLNKIEDGIFNTDAAVAALNAEVDTGWISLGLPLTYVSAAAPNYVVSTGLDLTGILSIGMKIRLTHAAATKYFIIVAISATQLTLYGGTDYTLSATAITLPYYSQWKSPFGFPTSPAKWTVLALSNNTSLTTGSVVQNTWYNATSFSVPIGVWNLTASYVQGCSRASAGTMDGYNTIGTTSAAAGLDDLTTYIITYNSTAGGFAFYASQFVKTTITATVATTYYLNYRTTLASMSNLYFRGDYVPTIVKLICAYL